MRFLYVDPTNNLIRAHLIKLYAPLPGRDAFIITTLLTDRRQVRIHARCVVCVAQFTYFQYFTLPAFSRYVHTSNKSLYVPLAVLYTFTPRYILREALTGI